MGGGADEVAHAPRREDGVVGADSDRVGRQTERGEHERARVVGRMDVHHVEAAPLEEPAEAARAGRKDGVEGLRAVAVERHGHAHVHHLEGIVRQHARVPVGRRGRPKQPAGQDRDLVATRREAQRLTMHVLGDPAELRVVVVGCDADAHELQLDQSAARS